MAVDLSATLDAPCSPATLFTWIDDLARYPDWLTIVPRAEPDDAASGDPGPAWSVYLRGRIGPLARSKRLRMVRTVHDPDRTATFERRDRDGREHAPWILRADVTPNGDGSRLVMHLHYGGSLWVPMVERLLRDEIERSRPQLLGCVATST